MRRPLIAAVALLAALFVQAPAAAVRASAPCPRIIAHRTLMLDRPENTVVGVQAVPATGAASRWTSSGRALASRC
jgi:glycerophosphoryl diester phosphodiesterase